MFPREPEAVKNPLARREQRTVQFPGSEATVRHAPRKKAEAGAISHGARVPSGGTWLGPVAQVVRAHA